MNSQGQFFIIVAPSGTGKTTLVRQIHHLIPKIDVSISYTTRPPRPNDRDGIDYHFIDQAAFAQMITENAFLEHALVYGQHYGTAKKTVLDLLNSGMDVMLEIDWQGAVQIKHQFQSAISIFILPPSMATLRTRLLQRKQDDPKTIERRLQAAQAEIRHCQHADYIVVNDQFEEALHALIHIIYSFRLKKSRQMDHYKKLLAEFEKTS